MKRRLISLLAMLLIALEMLSASNGKADILNAVYSGQKGSEILDLYGDTEFRNAEYVEKTIIEDLGVTEDELWTWILHDHSEDKISGKVPVEKRLFLPSICMNVLANSHRYRPSDDYFTSDYAWKIYARTMIEDFLDKASMVMKPDFRFTPDPEDISIDITFGKLYMTFSVRLRYGALEYSFNQRVNQYTKLDYFKKAMQADGMVNLKREIIMDYIGTPGNITILFKKGVHVVFNERRGSYTMEFEDVYLATRNGTAILPISIGNITSSMEGVY